MQEIFVVFPLWPSAYQAVLTGKTEVEVFSPYEKIFSKTVDGNAVRIRLPHNEVCLVRIRAVVCGGLLPVEACTWAIAGMSEILPEICAPAGFEVLLQAGQNNSLWRELNLDRFFERLREMKNPLDLDRELLQDRLVNRTVSYYSFKQNQVFPLEIVLPSGEWKSMNPFDDFDDLQNASFSKGLHCFFDPVLKKTLMLGIGAEGKDQIAVSWNWE